MSRQIVCFSVKLEQQSGLIFFSRIHFVSIDPFHVRENVSKLEDKTKEI